MSSNLTADLTVHLTETPTWAAKMTVDLTAGSVTVNQRQRFRCIVDSSMSWTGHLTVYLIVAAIAGPAEGLFAELMLHSKSVSLQARPHPKA